MEKDEIIQKIRALWESGIRENFDLGRQMCRTFHIGVRQIVQDIEPYIDFLHRNQSKIYFAMPGGTVLENIKNASFSDIIFYTFSAVDAYFEYINLHQDSFPGDKIFDFSIFKNLKAIGLYTCGMAGKFPESILRIKSLQKLQLNSTRLDTIPDLSPLENLFNISFDHNFISEIGGVPASCRFFFAYNQNLKVLPEFSQSIEVINVVNNKITKLPESLWTFRNLRVLDLSLNPIKLDYPEHLDHETVNHYFEKNRINQIKENNPNLSFFMLSYVDHKGDKNTLSIV